MTHIKFFEKKIKISVDKCHHKMVHLKSVDAVHCGWHPQIWNLKKFQKRGWQVNKVNVKLKECWQGHTNNYIIKVLLSP